MATDLNQCVVTESNIGQKNLIPGGNSLVENIWQKFQVEIFYSGP